MRGAERGGAKTRSRPSVSRPRGRASARVAAPAQKPALGLKIPLPKRPAAAAALIAACAAAATAIVLAGPARPLLARSAEAFSDRAARAGFRVGEVRLVGASADASADILRAADVPVGAPILGLDLDAVRRRIEAVGWVKSARVIRLWPNVLQIVVEQRQLVAVWQHAGKAWVVDANGVIAPEADPAKFARLPLVVGEGANAAAALILGPVLSRPRLAQRLDALVRVDDRRWDLRLKDGTIVQLPAGDEEAALIRLDQLDRQSHVLDLGLERIDLRDPEMVVVRPRAPTDTGAEGGKTQ